MLAINDSATTTTTFSHLPGELGESLGEFRYLPRVPSHGELVPSLAGRRFHECRGAVRGSVPALRAGPEGPGTQCPGSPEARRGSRGELDMVS